MTMARNWQLRCGRLRPRRVGARVDPDGYARRYDAGDERLGESGRDGHGEAGRRALADGVCSAASSASQRIRGA
jgi:hypothetical protein